MKRIIAVMTAILLMLSIATGVFAASKADLLTEAAKSPVGSNRLLYLPYLMGERTPHLDPDCRGVFFGLSAMHQKRDLIRSVMEGVTFALNDSMNILREMNV